MEKQTYKTIIFSTLTAANVVIWYEVLGIRFLLVLVLVIMGVILWARKK